MTPTPTEAARALAARRPIATYTCAVCGAEFEARRASGRRTPATCSNACYQRLKYRRKRERDA